MEVEVKLPSRPIPIPSLSTQPPHSLPPTINMFLPLSTPQTLPVDFIWHSRGRLERSANVSECSMFNVLSNVISPSCLHRKDRYEGSMSPATAHGSAATGEDWRSTSGSGIWFGCVTYLLCFTYSFAHALFSSYFAFSVLLFSFANLLSSPAYSSVDGVENLALSRPMESDTYGPVYYADH